MGKKNQIKMNHGPNVKPRSVKFQKKIGENVYCLGSGKGLLDATPKS